MNEIIKFVITIVIKSLLNECRSYLRCVYISGLGDYSQVLTFCQQKVATYIHLSTVRILDLS